MATTPEIPATMKQIMVKTFGTDFRKATEIVQVPVPTPGANEVLVRVRYVGINASDILFSNGAYKPGVPAPYPAGLEAQGTIVAVGDGSKFKVGQFAVALTFGCFSEYVVLPDDKVIPIPKNDPAFMSLGVSGTTASLALEKKANLKAGETVLVTGAAGGTGQFAVQLAKLAGCHVIGTCSSDEKATFLKSIGCNRPIVYTKENLDEVLKTEYPKGINVVYECIGKDVFDAALKNLATFGRLIVIGAVSAYEGPGKPSDKVLSQLPISFMALQKSADIRGFFLVHYIEEVGRHVEMLARHYATGQIKVTTDNGAASPNGPFNSLEKVYDAIDHLYAKSNKGKLVVEISSK